MITTIFIVVYLPCLLVCLFAFAFCLWRSRLRLVFSTYTLFYWKWKFIKENLMPNSYNSLIQNRIRASAATPANNLSATATIARALQTEGASSALCVCVT